MEQGQKEIRLADERMKTEAESRGEMPIQNGPEEKPEDVVEGETSPPKEGKRDEPQRGTPARNSNQGSGAKALLPPTQPPPAKVSGFYLYLLISTSYKSYVSKKKYLART